MQKTLQNREHAKLNRQIRLGEAGAAYAFALTVVASGGANTRVGWVAVVWLLMSAFGFLCVSAMYEEHMFAGEAWIGDSRALSCMRHCAEFGAISSGVFGGSICLLHGTWVKKWIFNLSGADLWVGSGVFLFSVLSALVLYRLYVHRIQCMCESKAR